MKSAGKAQPLDAAEKRRKSLTIDAAEKRGKSPTRAQRRWCKAWEKHMIIVKGEKTNKHNHRNYR